MVPCLYWAVARRSPGWFQALGAIVATVGLGFLSLRGNLTVSWGDALTLLGALLYGLHIMTTGFFAPKVPPSTLAVTQMAVSTAILVVVTPFVAHITLALGWQAWAAIVWTALSGTIYAFFIQSWAQRHTTSTHAAVLLCFESVFAAVSGVIFGLDTVTWRMVTGASLIFTGMLLIELLPGGGGENQAPAEALVPIASGDRARPAGPGPDEG
jgi:drug/metabolite transporter (DMT)-like permease